MSESFNQERLSFSQRHGLESLPQPLQPEEISPHMRNEFVAAVSEAIENARICWGKGDECFEILKVADWHSALRKHWVKIGKQYEQFDFNVCLIYDCQHVIKYHSFNKVFDLLEDLLKFVAAQQPRVF